MPEGVLPPGQSRAPRAPNAPRKRCCDGPGRPGHDPRPVRSAVRLSMRALRGKQDCEPRPACCSRSRVRSVCKSPLLLFRLLKPTGVREVKGRLGLELLAGPMPTRGANHITWGHPLPWGHPITRDLWLRASATEQRRNPGLLRFAPWYAYSCIASFLCEMVSSKAYFTVFFPHITHARLMTRSFLVYNYSNTFFSMGLGPRRPRST